MMSIAMDEKEMKVLAAGLAKNIKTEKGLSDFSKLLRKMIVEAALAPRWKSISAIQSTPQKAITAAIVAMAIAPRPSRVIMVRWRLKSLVIGMGRLNRRLFVRVKLG